MRHFGSHLVIKDKDEFIDECAFAFDAMDYADRLAQSENIRWFFKECYANCEEQIHFVIFDSYITEEYKDYLLSLKVVKNQNNKYDISIQKKTP